MCFLARAESGITYACQMTTAAPSGPSSLLVQLAFSLFRDGVEVWRKRGNEGEGEERERERERTGGGTWLNLEVGGY